MTDYLSKDKVVELPIVLFHPMGSRFTNQSMTIKRNSSIFFSGALTLIEDKLYLELQNFSFIRTSNTPTKQQMPWSLKSTQSSVLTSANSARMIHNLNKKTQAQDSAVADSNKNLLNTPPTSVERKSTRPFKLNIPSDKISALDFEEVEESVPTPPTPTSKNPSTSPISTKGNTRSSYKTNNKMQKPNTPSNTISDFEEVDPTSPTVNNSLIPEKRKTRSSYKTNKKTPKLADIASNIISVVDSEQEVEENEDF